MNLEKASAKTVNKLFGILCLIPCINILVSVVVSFFYFVSIVFKFNIYSFYIQYIVLRRNTGEILYNILQIERLYDTV